MTTGLLHDADGLAPEKALRQIDPGNLARSFAVNAIGPVLVMKHFPPLLPREGRSVFAVLSARVGSISDNRLGGWYAYRASKAALNQLVRTASIELARSHRQAIVMGLHPGTVATGLSEPFGDLSRKTAPAQSAENLLSVIASAEPDWSGGLFDWRGARILP